MRRCTYRVLELATSVLEDRGLRMAVFIRIEDVREHFLKIFLLEGWQGKIGKGLESEILDIQDNLYFFSQYCRKPVEESDDLLRTLANMSVEVMRTAEIGEAFLPSVDEIHPDFREADESQSCSPDSFAALLKTLSENAVPDPVGVGDEYPMISFTCDSKE